MTGFGICRILDEPYNNHFATNPKRQRPKPNMAWFVQLRSLDCAGRGVLDAANPSPNAGCMMKNGAQTVNIPKMSAGNILGV